MADHCPIFAEKSAAGYRMLAATTVMGLGLVVAAAARRGAMRRR